MYVASVNQSNFERTIMKKYLFLIALTLSLGFLSACNTIHGMGQDIQKAGSTIEDAAKKK